MKRVPLYTNKVSTYNGYSSTRFGYFMSSVDALFTPTVQRVLGATLSEPSRFFTLKELLQRAGSGRGGAQLQINRLVKAGLLVEAPRLGNQRRIRANTEHFLFAELQNIARKSFGLLEPVRDAIERIAPGVEQAFIFGSVAKGTDTSESDVDLMMVGVMNTNQFYDLKVELQATLGRTLHMAAYAPEEWENLVRTDPIISQIAAGPHLKVLPRDDKPTA